MSTRHAAVSVGGLTRTLGASSPRVARRTERRSGANARRRPGMGLRRRVLAAFRSVANGCTPDAALARTKAFYRSSGTGWSRCLA